MKLTFSARLTAADPGRRTITGRVVTWSEVGSTSAGPARFEPGSLELGDDVRLNLEHDRHAPIGRALELVAHDDGLDGTFRIAATRAGDDALVEAAEQLRDGLSVEVDVIDSKLDGDVLVITAGRLEGVALVTTPAIDSARVSRVAASQENPPEGTEPMTEPELVDDVVVDDVVEVVEVVEAARRSTPAARTTPRALRMSAAEYLLTYVAAARGDRDAGQLLTAANQATTDNPGIVPDPIVGEIINVLNSSRPVVSSSRSVPMPSGGQTFSRPIITQHTIAGMQPSQFTALDSQKMTITGLPVTKSTFGGSLAISFQNRDWTDPAILSTVIEDLRAQYAIQTETVTSTVFEAAVTAYEVLGATPDSEAFIKAAYAAAAKVSLGCGELPDTMWVAPDAWATVGSIVDGAKRPLFPSMGPVNAGGVLAPTSFSGNPLGLNLVVGPHLPVGTMIVGKSRFLETYEQVGGQLSATNVNTLSFDVAFYGYFAELVTVPGAFCSLVATEPAPLAKSTK